MAVHPWKVPGDVLGLIYDLKERFHHPRLEGAEIVACFEDSKAFKHERLNLGKVFKFSEVNKIWQAKPAVFGISISSNLWHDVLNAQTREAYLDLQLARCQVEYVPEMVVENGKKKPVKDDWGRTVFTNEIKVDENGEPKWRVVPLDLSVFIGNVRRYGLWCDDLVDFGEAVRSTGQPAPETT